MRDPYEVLGVKRDSSQREIKSAYRRLAKKLHPDLNPGDAEVAERFKEISAAYDIVTDPEKLARFDSGTLRQDGKHPGWSGPSTQTVAWDEQFGPGNSAADLFGDIAGNRRGRGGTSMFLTGEDMFFSIDVPFRQACAGTRVTVALPTSLSFETEIPAGIADREILPIKGMGFPGMGGGPPGNLNLEIRMIPDPVLRRDGADIHMELDLTGDEAARGGKRVVPTVAGETVIAFPPGARDGDIVRLPSAGVLDRASDRRGDQLVTLRVGKRPATGG